MRALKFISFGILLTFLASFLFSTVAFAQDDDLNNALAEFENDQITAKSLGIKEPSVLPGDTWYWWQSTRENIGLFFTFNQEKKLQKLQDHSNRRLLEARKLAEKGTDKASTKAQEALQKYNTTMDKVVKRLQENPNLKTKVLDKFDANMLRHQQVLNEVSEKLSTKLSDDKLEKIEQIKERQALNWYNVDPEKVQTRLETAIEDNEVGSKFRHLQNYATLEEVQMALPAKATEKVEAAKLKVEARLGEKLEDLDSNDQEKLEKYIYNIRASALEKEVITDELKDSDKLPQAVKNTVREVNTTYTDNLRQRFNNLSDEEKAKFLENFDERTHPAYLRALEEFEVPPSLEPRLQQIREHQEEGIKVKIQNTSDPIKLRTMEQNLQNYPILRLEAQEQRQKMPAPDPSPTIRMQQQNRLEQ